MLFRFGLYDNQRVWMCACTFSRNLAIMVNESPIEEISIHRGLNQRDHISNFLFLMVVEGLNGILRHDVDLDLLSKFRISSSNLIIFHHQYVNDTLIISKASMENLWITKVIFRGFELIISLRINFSKSFLVDVNVDSSFLDSASDFLNFYYKSLPLKYLSLPIGANPRSNETWEPLISTLPRCFLSQKHKFIILGDRVIPLSYIMNVIPIFFLYFIRMSVKVWKNFIKLHRRFLWGGVNGKDKIPWVSQVDVCNPNKNGGLGFRNSYLANLALLGKWRWGQIFELLVFKGILTARYGIQEVNCFKGGRVNKLQSASSFGEESPFQTLNQWSP